MRDHLNHLPFIEIVAAEDVKELRRKEQTYQGSWRRNGGSHAWQMIKRKIDRLLTMLAPLNASDVTNLLDTASAIDEGQALPGSSQAIADLIRKAVQGEDIFVQLEKDISGADGTVLAEVRDLRRYLLLVEARMQAEVVKGIRGDMVTEAHVNPLVDKITHRCKCDSSGGVDRYHEIGSPGCLYEKIAITAIPPEQVLEVRTFDGGEGCEANGPHDDQCCGRGTQGKSPEAPAPVPVSDSSRHAERAPKWHRCGTWVDHRWKVVPIIRAEWLEGAPQDLKDRFVITGSHAIVDRSQYSEEEREKKFPMRYNQTVTRTDYERLSNTDKELYEPREGVPHEWQLKKRFRADWGK